MKRFLPLILLMVLLIFSSNILSSQNVITISDELLINEEQNWTNDNIYLLDGYVFLEAGGRLNIEAGTVIKGKATPTTGDVSSALIISRGAQIFAEGTANNPIIFTAEFDDVNDSEDLFKEDKGLWGGLILLGNGVVGVDGGVLNIEGIPSTEGRAEYGGTDNADNSGVLKYVSIRHGGSKLEANNEINGLTLGGVGSGTTIDYIEVFANLDDGIEFFGGAVNVKHAAVSFCGDDSFDYDQSWDGNGQFWFTLQDEESNRAGEWDGSEASDLNPKANPTISNATFIGGGMTSNNEDNNDAMRIRDDASVQMYNSIVTGFARQAIVIDNDAAQDSWKRFVDGDMKFLSNIFFDLAAGTDLAALINTDGGGDTEFINYLVAQRNSIENPLLAGISRTNDNMLDPRINAGSPALTGAELVSGSFFDPVPYRGAFGNSDNWADNWTALSANGFFGDLVEEVQGQTIVIKDADINADEKVFWTAINEYILDGYVFVESGACLTIEPGTVIKGKASPSTGDGSSALIISKGGQIIADGRADAPIIFTAEFDDVNASDDLFKEDKGLWGGLVLLGNGVVGVDGGVQNIEGIPSTEGRAEYGGNDNTDNSGILRYVSIRHGGDKLEANNEINGLTLGGVGSGTTIDYIEVFANLDDGIEFFGGAVNVKHAVVSFCGDDSYDFDQSWDGNGQFWFSLQDEESNRAGEWDGSEASDLLPRVTPTIANATFIGAGDVSDNEDNNDALRIRDDAAAKVYCSIMTGFARQAIVIDNDANQDSYQRFLDGDIEFSQNVFFDFGAGNSFADIITTDGGDDNLLIDQLNNKGNLTDDPMMGGISRSADGGLDPRVSWGPAYTMGCTNVPSEDGFIDQVDYAGAFGNAVNWADSWTALSANGFFGNLVSGTDDNPLSEVDERLKVYPNPMENNGIISIELNQTQTLNLQILDALGRSVKDLGSLNMVEGLNDIAFDLDQEETGFYFIIIRDAEGMIIGKEMIVKK